MTEDNTPPAVKAVLDKPGKYVFIGTITAWLFEVDERGRVHQLKPSTMERDGILSAEGWSESSVTGIVKRIQEH
jgi:hypothetical protein